MFNNLLSPPPPSSHRHRAREGRPKEEYQRVTDRTEMERYTGRKGSGENAQSLEPRTAKLEGGAEKGRRGGRDGWGGFGRTGVTVAVGGGGVAGPPWTARRLTTTLETTSKSGNIF